jgi:hypothetical protein
MRGIGKCFRIYCHQNHKRWPELLSKFDKWLNGSVSDSTGYSPIDLMHNKPKPDLFKKFLTREADKLPPRKSIQEKAMKAYLRMKEKAAHRNRKREIGKALRNLQTVHLVLVKWQAVSDAVAGESSKFVRPYQGPFKVSKLYTPSAYGITEHRGRRAEYSIKILSNYTLESTEQTNDRNILMINT